MSGYIADKTRLPEGRAALFPKNVCGVDDARRTGKYFRHQLVEANASLSTMRLRLEPVGFKDLSQYERLTN